MRRKFFWMAPLAILAMVAFVVIGGGVVMYLWNWLLPALFGWRMITFWQAVGLLALCRILFGRIGGRGIRPNFRRRMHERWEHMTPEEREKFRQNWRSRCGPWEPPKAEGTA
jgi:hypothetical protein